MHLYEVIEKCIETWEKHNWRGKNVINARAILNCVAVTTPTVHYVIIPLFEKDIIIVRTYIDGHEERQSYNIEKFVNEFIPTVDKLLEDTIESNMVAKALAQLKEHDEDDDWSKIFDL